MNHIRNSISNTDETVECCQPSCRRSQMLPGFRFELNFWSNIYGRLWKNSWQITGTINLIILHNIPAHRIFRNLILFLRTEWRAILTCWETLHRFIIWAINTRRIYGQLTLVMTEGMMIISIIFRLWPCWCYNLQIIVSNPGFLYWKDQFSRKRGSCLYWFEPCSNDYLIVEYKIVITIFGRVNWLH